MTYKPLSPAMLGFSLATDVVMCLLGLAIHFRMLPQDFPILGQFSPAMGLVVAGAFAIGIPITLIAQRRALNSWGR